MEDAASAELRVTEPLKTALPALRGRDLAEELHHAEYPGLVRFLLLHGASWNEAQDAAQDAFTRCAYPVRVSAIPKPGCGRWPGVPGYGSRSGQRIRARRCRLESVVHWQTPAHAAELGVEERRVVELLLKLPAKQRAALAWTLDGFTTLESAEAMGITPEAARQNLARARATLKAELSLEGFSGTAGEEER